MISHLWKKSGKTTKATLFFPPVRCGTHERFARRTYSTTPAPVFVHVADNRVSRRFFFEVRLSACGGYLNISNYYANQLWGRYISKRTINFCQLDCISLQIIQGDRQMMGGGDRCHHLSVTWWPFHRSDWPLIIVSVRAAGPSHSKWMDQSGASITNRRNRSMNNSSSGPHFLTRHCVSIHSFGSTCSLTAWSTVRSLLNLRNSITVYSFKRNEFTKRMLLTPASLPLHLFI